MGKAPDQSFRRKPGCSDSMLDLCFAAEEEEVEVAVVEAAEEEVVGVQLAFEECILAAVAVAVEAVEVEACLVAAVAC